MPAGIPPALSTISVFVGLPLTTKVPDVPAATLDKPRPIRSTFSSNFSSYRNAYAREVAALWARITRKRGQRAYTKEFGNLVKRYRPGSCDGPEGPPNRADRCYTKGLKVKSPARNDGADDRKECPGYLFQEMAPDKDDDQDKD